jgi:hypothetical protein
MWGEGNIRRPCWRGRRQINGQCNIQILGIRVEMSHAQTHENRIFSGSNLTFRTKIGSLFTINRVILILGARIFFEIIRWRSNTYNTFSRVVRSLQPWTSWGHNLSLSALPIHSSFPHCFRPHNLHQDIKSHGKMIPENRATSQRVRKLAKAIIHVLTSDATTGLTLCELDPPQETGELLVWVQVQLQVAGGEVHRAGGKERVRRRRWSGPRAVGPHAWRWPFKIIWMKICFNLKGTVVCQSPAHVAHKICIEIFQILFLRIWSSILSFKFFNVSLSDLGTIDQDKPIWC